MTGVGAPGPDDRGPAPAFRAGIVDVAAPVVIVGAALAIAPHPGWIGFEQERSGVPALTGFTRDEVRRVTAGILSDLVVGPPSFAVSIDGRPVLDAAERAHMADVRRLLLAFGAVVALAFVALVTVLVPDRRQPLAWRGVSRGATVLAVVIAVAGAWVLISFDTAFVAFHLVTFPQGDFAFDPLTQRLVQLFPERFWSDAAVAMGLLLLAMPGATAALAERRAGRLSRATGA